MEAFPPVKGPIKPILTFSFARDVEKNPVVPMNITTIKLTAKIFNGFDMMILLYS
jgi:hypothetical protein